MNKVLVTGFEPFGGDSENPSQRVAALLDGRTLGTHIVVGATLPCAFRTAPAALLALVRRHRPRAVICLGLAGNAAAIRVERIAVNRIDARIPDNQSRQPTGLPVVVGGPAAYRTGLPARKIVERLRRENIAASLSGSAGTFVCNQVFYRLLHALRRRTRPPPSGFIHLPPFAVIPLAAQARAIALAIEETLSS